MTIEFRELRTAAELAPHAGCSRRGCGAATATCVSVNMLVATISEGGMAIGAFDGDRLVGSVYGFATHEPDVLHSHYLAVDPEYRGTRARRGVEAAPARVVPGQRAHGDALDVRPAAARQRAPQPALARRGRRAVPRRPLRADGRHQRWSAERSARGGMEPRRADGSSARNRSRSRCRRSPPTRSPSATARRHACPRRAPRCDGAAVRRRLGGHRRRSRRAAPTPSAADLRPFGEHVGELGEDLADLGGEPITVRAVEVAQVGAVPAPVGVDRRNPAVVESLESMALDDGIPPRVEEERQRVAIGRRRGCGPDAESIDTGPRSGDRACRRGCR